MNVVMIVMIPTVGNTMEPVAPISTPPTFATTSANSPPENDKPQQYAPKLLCLCAEPLLKETL